MRCPSCGTENPESHRFCRECGSPLAEACPSCGAPVDAGSKFCGRCGAAVRPAAGAPGVPPPAAPIAERRVCSVLFADLVGFTPLAEARDAEAVRELLSGYFDQARKVIARYGGTVEKFIGDAVMAVWGVPTAHEDDAERCVRAALELVDAVAEFGVSTGAPELAARAGVVTGEVAVTLGATGEGMVAGDAVNTAARVQAAAEPGSVLVDDTSRQTTTRAISYTSVGARPLKGKEDPVPLWRAVRVVGTVGGSERVDGLEAGFLGRDRELRAVKEAFHTTAETSRARLVSVVGAAGVGKSRLRWEFSKYIDGLADVVLWHSGRCLSYGEGVAYWALAEMVRQRFGIAEEEGGAGAADKLAAGLSRWIDEPADREFLQPRLSALLGVGDPGLGRDELFAGWRLFFERLAGQQPVLLVVEDLQWADEGLLDFFEHLLDWSADFPICVLTFSRPELADRRPTWAAARRNATALALDPLPDAVMRTLLGELVPGLPAQLADRIVAQADGIPLYAVETVRSLVDRDLVQPIDGVYRLVGEVASLDIPASLASLVAARIDGLPPGERALVQGLAVLGSTFPRAAVAAVAPAGADLDGMLADLVRREILAVRTDHLSPDRGQYTFSQTLLRQVAYDTLSRRERKAVHLAVAAHLRAAFPDDGADVAEVVANHYRDALTAVPEDPDAAELRAEAVAAFARAGTRAKAVGAPDAAERAYAAAAGLCTDETERARLLEEAGEAALLFGRGTEALAYLETALEIHSEAGRRREAARLVGPVSRALGHLGRGEQAIPRMREAIVVLTEGEPDAVLAQAHAELALTLLFSGHRAAAFEHADAAVSLAQALELPAVLARAAGGRAVLLVYDNRPQEGLIHFQWAVDLAERHGLGEQARLAHNNAGSICVDWDLPGAIEHSQTAMDAARRAGDRPLEAAAAANLARAWLYVGRWSEGAQLCLELAPRTTSLGGAEHHHLLAVYSVLTGDAVQARQHLAEQAAWEGSDDVQFRTLYGASRATVALAEGDLLGALALASDTCRDSADTVSLGFEAARQAWPDAMEAALALDRLDDAEGLIHLLADRPVGHVPPYLRAQLARFRARLAAARGDHDEVESHFRQAEEAMAALAYPYWLGRIQLDHASWLVDRGRAAEAAPLLEPATATFEQLGAAPALAAARALAARAGVPQGQPSAVPQELSRR